MPPRLWVQSGVRREFERPTFPQHAEAKMLSRNQLAADVAIEAEVLDDLEQLHADLLQFIFEWEAEQRSLPPDQQEQLLCNVSDRDLLTGARPMGRA